MDMVVKFSALSLKDCYNMSRVAKNPIPLPSGVVITLAENEILVKGAKGTLRANIHPNIGLEVNEHSVTIKEVKLDRQTNALAGTTRALVANMVAGVNSGYVRKLSMVGVGYRAQAKGSVLNLSLGFSHPIDFPIPEGISIETPSQTEIHIKGCDKQMVGQVAANIRAFRPPEPYKGKGVRYAEEIIVRKEAKKK